MIKELINFTNMITREFPNIMSINQEANKGLHVFIEIDENGNWVNQDLKEGKDYNFYNGKIKDFSLWDDCVQYQVVSNYITMNKVKKFDAKQKIHSCSPFAVAFNFNFNDNDMSALGIRKWGKGERPTNDEKSENEQLIRSERLRIVKERLDSYKENSYRLYFEEEFEYSKIVGGFFQNMNSILDKISALTVFELLSTKDYLRIVLKSIPYEVQQLFYQKYLKSEIFNDEKLSHQDFGIIGAINDYPSKKPYLKHQTSPFIKGIGQRYTREEALVMDNFKKIIAKKDVLPKPLPIFIHEEELKKESIKIIKKAAEEGDKLSYREIIEKLYDKHLEDIGNYYLLFYDGKEIRDFDFVSKFEYNLKNNDGNKWEIKDYFEGGNTQTIKNVFHFQQVVLQLVFNNGLVTRTKNGSYQYKYFDEIDSNYCKSDITYIQILKYRKAFYDFIYKSKRQSITSQIFHDILQTAILEDIRLDEIKSNYHTEERNIRQKLNIWFSLTNNFINAKNNQVMSSKLQTHREFIIQLADGKTNIETDEEYAFTVGQIIYYLLSKSKTADRSYKRLEPFMQQVHSKELNKSIARLFDAYKHENFSRNFRVPFAQVLSYETKVNVRDLIPTILSGIFSDNALFSSKEEKEETEIITEN